MRTERYNNLDRRGEKFNLENELVAKKQSLSEIFTKCAPLITRMNRVWDNQVELNRPERARALWLELTSRSRIILKSVLVSNRDFIEAYDGLVNFLKEMMDLQGEIKHLENRLLQITSIELAAPSQDNDWLVAYAGDGEVKGAGVSGSRLPILSHQEGEPTEDDPADITTRKSFDQKTRHLREAELPDEEISGWH